MKKLFAFLLFVMSTSVFAHGGYYGNHRGGYYHYNHRSPCYGCWVAPAIIGGAIAYGLSRPTIVPSPPVTYIEQPQVQLPPPGYHWEYMIDPQTGAQKLVAVPN